MRWKRMAIGMAMAGAVLLGMNGTQVRMGASADLSRVYDGSLTVEQMQAIVEQQLDHVPGRLLVKFKNGVEGSSRSAALSRVGGAARRDDLRYADFSIVDLDTGADVEGAAAQLEASGLVEYAELDYLRRPHFTPNDPGFRDQWNLRLINADKAWDINRGASSNVVVAVIDSGAAILTATWRMARYDGRQFLTVDVPLRAAPDLATPGRFVKPWDFVWDDAQPVDFGGHGTHVAGTVAQSTNNGEGVAGIAFNARIMPLKVCADNWDALFALAGARIRHDPRFPPASLLGCPDSLQAQALRYAADNGAHVANLSLGGPYPNAAVQDALRYATSRGVFVTIAAGNEALEGNPTSYPAAYAASIDGAVAIGAVDRNSRRSYYSNVGSYVEFVAPGGDVRGGLANGIWQQTLDDDFTDTRLVRPRFDILRDMSFQGTSMAAPHIAGLAALMIDQGYKNPATIEAALRHLAVDLGAPGRDSEYGYGLVDARAVLRGMGVAR